MGRKWGCDLDNELWLPVVGHEGRYEVSNVGRVRSTIDFAPIRLACGGVRSVPRKILRPIRKNNGYEAVCLSNPGVKSRMQQKSIHALVLEAFVGPKPDGMEACHNNGVRHDNRVENLRWDTRKGNHADRVLHGTHMRGEESGTAKLTASIVLAMRRGEIRPAAVARLFGVNLDTASRAKNRVTWRHLEQSIG